MVLTMLPSGRHLLEAYTGLPDGGPAPEGGEGTEGEPQGLLAAARPGTVFLDCSTIDVAESRRAAELATAAGHRSVDAPVSGGVVGAEAGLARLKQKDEEWKRAQREWNKVWREVDARNFYKALDHQGVNFKSADKKAITTKALVHEIETLVATQQQRRLAMDPSLPRLAPRSQLSFVMDDPGVCADILRLVAHYMDRAALSDQDRHRLEHVCKTILPRMLGAGPDALADLLKRSDDEEEADKEHGSDARHAHGARRASGARRRRAAGPGGRRAAPGAPGRAR